MKRIAQIFFVTVGFISFALGAVGVVVPVLPTTPFLLLAAACFAKGSRRFHVWFMGTKLYQRYIEDMVFRKEMTVAKKAKVLSIVTIFLMIGFIASPVIYAKVIIEAVIAGHYYYFLFCIRTAKEGSEECETIEAVDEIES